MTIIREGSRRPKILCILGTRPEAIKMAPIIRELERHKGEFHTRVCVTAQQRHLLDQALRLFRIPVHHDLDIMRQHQSLEDLTNRSIRSIAGVVARERPDMILVQGDTTTTFCAALAGFYKGIPVGHIEAGLRTWNRDHPFPEELNRTLTSRLATLHFAPTRSARSNLLSEGISNRSIIVTGNTVVDALHWMLGTLEAPRSEKSLPQLREKCRIILVTGHRRESFGEGFRNICDAIRTIALTEQGVEIVYPVHLNPNVRGPVARMLSRISNVHLIAPLPYDRFIYLMSRSYLILTDSGGVQEEAPSLGKPVLVMRSTTERPEGVQAGTVRLVGTESPMIVREVRRLLTDRSLYRKMSRMHNPYGDGRAARRIVAALRKKLT